MHDIGINAGHGAGVVCDCGQDCADLTAWHEHTVRAYNDPNERAIRLRGSRVHSVVPVEPHSPACVRACVKVACAAYGNGRECWTLTITGSPASDTGSVFFGLPSRQLAEDLAARGGVVSATYQVSTC
ncbi:hypothetical protein [Actinophytocola xanthii]|uniref:Uncharacterized protein n=1 Tax=Actinophytocola xanthii TaxID=1912961 RepID=A0A1Q8CGM7_9PSEU|nr:hypothetical protein [Actinophytocola xanthii]OLF13494.1 hypothetical protein BU204_27245 [Actinophytocola xanthii]